MVVQPDDTVTIACKLAPSPKQPQAQVRVVSPVCTHLSLRDVTEACLLLRLLPTMLCKVRDEKGPAAQASFMCR